MTFDQLFWCHSLILVLHLLLDPLETVAPRLDSAGRSLNLWLVLKVGLVSVENLLVPVFFFSSSWTQFADLWAGRNTFFSGRTSQRKFSIIGNWRPLERGDSSLGRTQQGEPGPGQQECLHLTVVCRTDGVCPGDTGGAPPQCPRGDLTRATTDDIVNMCQRFSNKITFIV